MNPTPSTVRQTIEDALELMAPEYDGRKILITLRGLDAFLRICERRERATTLSFMNECKKRLPQEHIDEIFLEMFPD